MAPARKKSFPKKRPVCSISRKDFVGALMSNLLFQLQYHPELPQYVREAADRLQRQWDEVCDFRLLNPIVIAELEAQLFTKDIAAADKS